MRFLISNFIIISIKQDPRDEHKIMLRTDLINIHICETNIYNLNVSQYHFFVSRYYICPKVHDDAFILVQYSSLFI